MTTIITVHGTNAGDESDTGDQWWQQGSEFQEKLSEYVEASDGRLEFKPFHWGVGPNSELKRRDAGNDLRREMLELEKEEEPYSVIGHSHGGSVLNHALFSVYAKNLSLLHMKSWVTVGTPFILTDRQGSYFNRFNFIGKVGLIIAFVSALSGLILALAFSIDNMEGALSLVEYSDQQIVSGLFVGILIIIAARMYTIRPDKRLNIRHKNRYCTKFQQKWTNFNHPKDEAIKGLQNANLLELKIFDRKSLGRGIAPISVIFVAALWGAHEFIFQMLRLNVVYADSCINPAFLCNVSANVYLSMYSYGIDGNDPSWLREYFDSYNTFRGALGTFIIEERNMGSDYETRNWIMALSSGPIFILLALVSTWIVTRGLGIALSYPAAAFLNGQISNRVKSKAYGADSYGERVAVVSNTPTGNDILDRAFPQELANEIEDYTEQYAIDAIRKIRALIGSNIASSDNPITDQISDTLSWKELIHTAYFDVDNFIKLVAVCLCESALVTPSAKLKNDPEYKKVCGWYQQM